MCWVALSSQVSSSMEQHASISSVVDLGHKLGSESALETESLHDVLTFNSEKKPILEMEFVSKSFSVQYILDFGLVLNVLSFESLVQI